MPLTKPYQKQLEALTPRTRPVTEEEAKMKRCPFLSFEPCEASDCMLWRWKNYGTTGDHVAPTGYCGAGGDPS